jgi:hypothetical protein
MKNTSSNKKIGIQLECWSVGVLEYWCIGKTPALIFLSITPTPVLHYSKVSITP